MNILILDDDPERMSTFKDALKGNTLRFARTASQAILCLKFEDRFDVVFLDHDLGEFGNASGYSEPAGDGMEVVTYMILSLDKDKHPEEVIVHSHNNVASPLMVQALKVAGFKAIQREFEPGMFKKT